MGGINEGPEGRPRRVFQATDNKIKLNIRHWLAGLPHKLPPLPEVPFTSSWSRSWRALGQL